MPSFSRLMRLRNEKVFDAVDGVERIEFGRDRFERGIKPGLHKGADQSCGQAGRHEGQRQQDTLDADATERTVQGGGIARIGGEIETDRHQCTQMFDKIAACQLHHQQRGQQHCGGSDVRADRDFPIPARILQFLFCRLLGLLIRHGDLRPLLLHPHSERAVAGRSASKANVCMGVRSTTCLFAMAFRCSLLKSLRWRRSVRYARMLSTAIE